MWHLLRFEMLEERQMLTLPTTSTNTLTGLNGPQELVINSNNDLYVANITGTTVSEFAPGSTTPTATLTGLNFPIAVTLVSRGDVFVANYGNGAGLSGTDTTVNTTAVVPLAKSL